MTSFADLVHARWRLLAEPGDPAGGRAPSGTAQRLTVAGLFTRSRHVAALEAS
jgi:hypothetical protein